jgi:hypothetical protein
MKARAMQANRLTSREIGCAGKHRFASFAMADRVASRTAHRRGKKFQAYACDACGGFHIGSAIGGSKQRGGVIDPRKPYVVHARNREGHVRVMGRSASPDGGRLPELIAPDGWEVVRIVRAGA